MSDSSDSRSGAPVSDDLAVVQSRSSRDSGKSALINRRRAPGQLVRETSHSPLRMDHGT